MLKKNWLKSANVLLRWNDSDLQIQVTYSDLEPIEVSFWASPFDGLRDYRLLEILNLEYKLMAPSNWKQLKTDNNLYFIASDIIIVP